ncbi:hypothetical protein L2E82_08213 [Cichorium intybus]|uniref:Uncharacterized protein n=1 Tax=Cichorium intybus TaxID=13427 RepID=A0ACB9G6J7_CICIN|nr:hypothetical protein L2E82_08213 [Cichorium intybus]
MDLLISNISDIYQRNGNVGVRAAVFWNNDSDDDCMGEGAMCLLVHLGLGEASRVFLARVLAVRWRRGRVTGNEGIIKMKGSSTKLKTETKSCRRKIRFAGKDEAYRKNTDIDSIILSPKSSSVVRFITF